MKPEQIPTIATDAGEGTEGRRHLLHVGWLADGAGRFAAPGALLLDGATVVAAGTPESIGSVPEMAAQRWPEVGVLPALVNAHTHLDLTALGCLPFDGAFAAWLSQVRSARQGMDAAALATSVQSGLRALEAGGVAAVGDIASSDAVVQVVGAGAAAGLAGVVFQEVFGMGPGRPAALETVRVLAGVAAQERGEGPVWLRRGIQPHAPYSSDASVFEAALASGAPVATHLAESPAERRFLASGEGPFRALLESLGLWDGTVSTGARHPVEWLAARLAAAPNARILCAHLNDLDDEAMALLPTLPVDVVYCPRASAYFGYEGHRYRTLRQRGVRVCLGTDSLVCLQTPDRLSTLDDARLLLQRDGLPLQDALQMACDAGAAALGLPVEAFTLSPGAKAGVLGVTSPSFRGVRSPAEAAVALAATTGAPTWIARSRPASWCVAALGAETPRARGRADARAILGA